MTNIRIRKIGPGDIRHLQEIGRRTFFETFAADNTEEDMASYLEEAYSLPRLTQELQQKGSQFHFAELDGQVIGYLKVNTGEAQTEPMGEDAMEIERIYVLKEFHGQRVGQLLFDKAMAIAREADLHQVWLGVWENNPRAIAFYRKNGFAEFGRHKFQLGDDEQTDVLMRREVKE